MAIIVIHTNPDFDCITGAWLLRRFVPGFEEAIIEFVNTGNPDQVILSRADAVIDTGKIYDPSDFRFDHHQLPGQASSDTCAAAQVFNYLVGKGGDLAYLQPLIDMIFCGDTGRKDSGADWSRLTGIHALLSGLKAICKERLATEHSFQTWTFDEHIFADGCKILDALETHLRHRYQAKLELDSKVVYKSSDNLLWAIRHGSAGSTFAAFEEGARLVVWEGEPLEVKGGISYPIGVNRAPEWNWPHCGELIDGLISALDPELSGEIIQELSSWFKHPAGFFAGRGTAKAPVFKPVEIDLERMTRHLDIQWQR